MDPISGHSAESSLGHSIPLTPSEMASTEPPAHRQSNPVEIEISQVDSSALVEPLENTGSPQPSKSSAPIPPRRDSTPSPLKRPPTPLSTPLLTKLRLALSSPSLESPAFALTEKEIAAFPRCFECRPKISPSFSGLPDDPTMQWPARQLERDERCPVCWVLSSTLPQHQEFDGAICESVDLSSESSALQREELNDLADIEHIIYKNVVFVYSRLGVWYGCMVEVRPISPAPMLDWVLANLRHSVVDIEAVRIWIDECCNSHERSCRVQEERGTKITGMRLIDVNTRKIVQAAAGMSYAALSYVWGGAKLSDTGISQHLPYPAPKTIEDSVVLAQNLSIPYLWVDGYCVSQLDNVEKHFQVSQMHKIYERARVTFIAAAGRDVHHGFPGVAGTPRQAQPHFTLDKRIFAALMPHPMDSIRASKWSSRGWTYQEALLSTRRLVFTDSQTYFECNNPTVSGEIDEPIRKIARAAKQTGSGESCCSHAIDSVGIRIRPRHEYDRLAMPRQNRIALDIWKHVSNVSKRNLTFETDKINVLKGIFGDFVDTGHLYGEVCGIPIFSSRLNCLASQEKLSWTEGFLMGLLWDTHETAARREQYPSWSWAGWKRGPQQTPFTQLGGRMDPSVRVWFETKDGRRLRGEEYQRLYDAGNGADFDGSWPYLLLDVPVLRYKLRLSLHHGIIPYILIDENEMQVEGGRFELTQENPTYRGEVSWKWLEDATWDGLVFGQESGGTKVLVVEDCGDHVERLGAFILPQSYKEYFPPEASIHAAAEANRSSTRTSLTERRLVRLG